MKACESCPNRQQADTLESLAEAAKSSILFRVFAPVLRRRAKEIREAGCGNWHELWETTINRESGRVTDEKLVRECNRQRLLRWIDALHQQTYLTGKTADSERNIISEGFSALTGRPIRGDFKSLPGDIRAALKASEAEQLRHQIEQGSASDNGSVDE